MGQIYLVRHGQASFGSANYDRLSELGLEQARSLGERFANSQQRFTKVVCGAMQRHRQTADACMAMLPKSLCVNPDSWHTDPAFNEYDHHEVLVRQRPDFEDPKTVLHFLANTPNSGAAFQDLFAAAMARWMSGRHDTEYRETWLEFRHRCINAMQCLAEGSERSQSIVVFTSGGTISSLCQHLLGMGERETARLNWSLVNTGVTRLLYQPGRVSLSYLNNYAHLELPGKSHMVTYR